MYDVEEALPIETTLTKEEVVKLFHDYALVVQEHNRPQTLCKNELPKPPIRGVQEYAFLGEWIFENDVFVGHEIMPPTILTIDEWFMLERQEVSR